MTYHVGGRRNDKFAEVIWLYISLVAGVLSYLYDDVCDFSLSPFNANVCCFAWQCWPKWSVSVLEWLSERLLGRMSDTFLDLVMNDRVVSIRVVCGIRRVDFLGFVFGFCFLLLFLVCGGGGGSHRLIVKLCFLLYVYYVLCCCFYLSVTCRWKANFHVIHKLASVSVSNQGLLLAFRKRFKNTQEVDLCRTCRK